MKKVATTLVDVAKRASVSVVTASRALNDKGASNNASETVSQAARGLGYEPNGLARMMKGRLLTCCNVRLERASRS